MNVDVESEQQQAPDTGSYVSFLLASQLKGLCFNPCRIEPLTFRIGAPEVTISVQSKNTSETGNEGFDNLECKATCVLPAERDTAYFIANLIRGIYTPIPGSPVALPVRVKGEDRIDREGKILTKMALPFELYPSPVQALWTKAKELLLQTQERFLRLLRWTQDFDGPHDLFESQPALYWRSEFSVPGDEHYATSRPEEAARDIRGIWGIAWGDCHSETMLGLWAQGSLEPLGHELLREARRLASLGSYRGAVLMAATAVEAGVKEHIGRLRPHTHWILQHAPSPPIHKILRNYVPEMHAGTSIISDWKSLTKLWNACQNLAEARNETTHSGAGMESASLHEHLVTASDVLYVLDALAGHQWARQRVSHSLRAALGWPAPSEDRVWARVLSAKWEVDSPS
jgi:hypothetical protein